MAQTLVHSGFGGVTFSTRHESRYGIRPIPYYEFDGLNQKLENIQNHLFRCGISSSLKKDRLQITGLNNCLLLCNILNIDNNWAWAVKNIFYRKRHRQPNGIRTLFMLFGDKSHLSQQDVDRVIRGKVETRLFNIAKNPQKLRLLPDYATLYKHFNTTKMFCDCCGKVGIKIFFAGKLNNLFFLCKSCQQKL